MPRARRKRATRSRSHGRSILMGGTGRRRRGVRKMKRGHGVLSTFTNLLGLGRRRRTSRGKSRTRGSGFPLTDLGRNLIKLATNPVSIAMMKASGRRRTRGGAMKKPSHTPAASAQAAAVAPAKSGSRVKTALKGLAGLATALGAAYLGNKAYQTKNRQDVTLTQLAQRANLPRSPYSHGYRFNMQSSNV